MSIGRDAPIDAPIVVDDVLDRELTTSLLQHVDPHGWFRSPMIRPDAAGNAVLVADVTVKARHDHRLEDRALTAAIGSSLVARLLPAVQRSFGITPLAHEAFKIVRYDAGDGWFTPHRDNVTPDAAHRLLAVTINLDDGYEGGDLRFPELGPTLHRPRPGAAIVFPCHLLHEVTPVLAGTRRALITFLW